MMDAATWKRGLTRLYVTAWAVWVVVALIWAGSGQTQPVAVILAVTIAGVLLPGILLLLLRWVFDGFTKPRGSHGAPLLILVCMTGLLTCSCDKTTAPKVGPSLEPVLVFTRWDGITVSNGVGLALGWCKNVGTITAYHVLASACTDNSGRWTSQPSIAPGDSANFWHPAVDSSGVWVYPSCTPHIGGVSNP